MLDEHLGDRFQGHHFTWPVDCNNFVPFLGPFSKKLWYYKKGCLNKRGMWIIPVNRFLQKNPILILIRFWKSQNRSLSKWIFNLDINHFSFVYLPNLQPFDPKKPSISDDFTEIKWSVIMKQYEKASIYQTNIHRRKTGSW